MLIMLVAVVVMRGTGKWL